jgi:hypothetical protein
MCASIKTSISNPMLTRELYYCSFEKPSYNREEGNYYGWRK